MNTISKEDIILTTALVELAEEVGMHDEVETILTQEFRELVISSKYSWGQIKDDLLPILQQIVTKYSSVAQLDISK